MESTIAQPYGAKVNDRDAYDWHIGWPELGGDDKIYGGDLIPAPQLFVGGSYDDKIYVGYGSPAPITVYGDKSDFLSNPIPELIAINAYGDK